MCTLKKLSVCCCIISAAIFLSAPAWAFRLSFSPSASFVPLSDSVSVDIIISGLENSDVSVFDFNVNYDPGILAYESYVLGNGLGSLIGGDAGDLSLGDLGSGVINLYEYSYLRNLDSQPSAFSLATLTFAGIHEGSSILSFSDSFFYDENGELLSLTLSENGFIDVTATPEPGTMLLSGLGLITLAALMKIRRNRLFRTSEETESC